MTEIVHRLDDLAESVAGLDVGGDGQAEVMSRLRALSDRAVLLEAES